MKNNKLFALSVAALLGLGTVGSLGIRAFNKKVSVAGNETLAESTKVDSVGNGISFGNHILRAGETNSVNSVIGVQLMDGTTAGTSSIRFVAALTGYQGLSAAKWSRSAIIDGDTTVKEAAEFNVETVYTSVADAESIKWSTAPTEDYTYYMVYTLANIPAAYDYSTIDVSFNVTSIDGTVSAPVTQKANVVGMKGDQSKGVKFVAATASGHEGEYFACAYSTAITEAVITEDYIKYDGYVGTYMGKVTGLSENATGSGSNGAFENCTKLTKITIPETVYLFDSWCFSKAPLTEITFPKALTKIGSYALYNLTTVKKIVWNATNLPNQVDLANFAGTDVEIEIAADVESLPSEKIFADAASIAKITYHGTEAQWAALIAGNTSKLKDVTNVICSDTVVATYTYHLNGGNLGGSTEDVTETVVVGKPAKGVKPLKDGQRFVGWFTAAEDGEEFDVTANATGDKELYAHYEDLPAGVSLENPHVLTADSTFSVDLIPGMDIVYFSFTPAESGRYVLDGTFSLDTALSEYQYASAAFRDWNNGGAKVASLARTSTAALQYTYTSTSAILNIDAVAGTTYSFSFQIYYSTYYNYKVYGSSEWSFTKSTDNDAPSSAAVVDLATETGARHVLPKNGTSQYNYWKITPEETKEVYFQADLDGSTWGGVYLYEGAEDGSFQTSKELAYAYGTNNTSRSGSKTVTLEAGKTYYVLMTYNSNNTNNDDTKYVGFVMGEPPAGGSVSRPAVDVFAPNGEKLTVKSALAGGTMNYYKITIDHAGQYKLNYSKSSTYNEGTVGLYQEDGTEIAVATSKKSGSGWSESYANSTDIVETLEPGTYIVAAGWTGTTWRGDFSITMTEMLPGSEYANAIAMDLSAGSASINPSLANTYYTATLTKGAHLISATGAATKVTVYDSSKAVVATWNAGDEEGAYMVTNAADYYIMVTGEGESTITLEDTAIRPDGKSRDTAYTPVFDENHRLDLTQYQKSTSQDSVWFKVEVASAGDYRLWTDTVQSGTSGDSKMQGFYKDDSTTSIKPNNYSSNTIDDNGSSYPEYCHHRYDFYAEFTITEPGTYYFGVKISATNATITSFELGWERIGGDVDPEPEPDPEPETPAETAGYLGTWMFSPEFSVTFNADGTGTATIDEDTESFTYTYADGSISVGEVDGFQTIGEGETFSYDAASGTLIYEGYACDAEYYEAPGMKVGGSESAETPAYCGTWQDGTNTLVINADGTAVWNGVHNLTYTWYENGGYAMGIIAPMDPFDGEENAFAYDAVNDQIQISLWDEYEEVGTTCTMTRVA